MLGVTLGRFGGRSRAWRVGLAVVVAAGVALGAAPAHADPAEAKKIFTTRCMACHTFGKGVKVGPDLKGVTERRQRAWLLKFIRSSQTVIAAGDPTAAGLFEQFKQQRMPDWTDLSEDQITSILDWLAASGPDQRAPDERVAESTTHDELAAGRALFHGAQALAGGGVACAACHSVREEDGSRHGGTLAADLSRIFSQYQDTGMTLFLRHPCFARYPDSTYTAFLAPQEAFSIKAYLRAVALADQPSGPAGPTGDDGRDPSAAPLVAKTVDTPGDPPPPVARPPAEPARRVTWAPRGPAAAPDPRRGGVAMTGLFLVFPYVAAALLIFGLGVRHALARRRPHEIGHAAAAAWATFRGSLAWRIGLGVTALAHLAALCVPGAVMAWNRVPLRLYLLEATGLVFGVVALWGVVQLLWRQRGRLHLPDLADSVLLSLIVVAIGSGLLSAVLYRWGSSWGLVTTVPYLRSLASASPAPLLVEQMPFVVRLHVFSWFALLAVAPFTSAAMLPIAAGDRILLAFAHVFGALGGRGRRALARLSPARWLWPEEDLPRKEPG